MPRPIQFLRHLTTARALPRTAKNRPLIGSTQSPPSSRLSPSSRSSHRHRRSVSQAWLGAIGNLPIRPQHLLLDSFPLSLQPPSDQHHRRRRRLLSIAAASIIAKVARDHLRDTHDGDFPGYVFSPTRATTRPSTSVRSGPRTLRPPPPLLLPVKRSFSATSSTSCRTSPPPITPQTTSPPPSFSRSAYRIRRHLPTTADAVFHAPCSLFPPRTRISAR